MANFKKVGVVPFGDPKKSPHSSIYDIYDFFVEIGHEIISTPILSRPLIQVGQLSVTGGRTCTKYCRVNPAQEKCG